VEILYTQYLKEFKLFVYRAIVFAVGIATVLCCVAKPLHQLPEFLPATSAGIFLLFVGAYSLRVAMRLAWALRLLQWTMRRLDLTEADAAEGLFKFQLYRSRTFEQWRREDFVAQLKDARDVTSMCGG